MPAVASFRLPGVYFLPAPRAVAAELPPLDVAGLVGLATRGPCDLPVPIEDLAAFDAVFGGPFAVAREPDGRPALAYLRDAVATFFSSGGRRCYAVRVAGTAATPARLAVPGMVAVDSRTGAATRVEIAASAVGSWGEALRIGTILAATPLPLGAFPHWGGRSLAWKTRGAPRAVQPGDLLRLAFDDGSQWLFPVAAKTPPSTKDTPDATLVADTLWPVQTVLGGTPPQINSLSQMSGTGSVPLGVAATLAPLDGGIGLWLAEPDSLRLVRGDMLVIDAADGAQYALTVADTAVATGFGSLPGPFLAVTARELVRLRDAGSNSPNLPGAPAQLTRVERLQLTLAIKYGDTSARIVGSLGFNAAHPRFWGDIAAAESGSLAGGSASSPGAAQQQQARPLAPAEATKLYRQLFGAKRKDFDWTDPNLMTVLSTLLAPPASTGLTYLPLGMAVIGSDADLAGAERGSANDGLERFTAALFLDPNLIAGAGPQGGGLTVPATLLSAATDLYNLQDIRLKGIHSLMFVDEVALIGVPDAIQRGWKYLPAPAVAAPVAPPPPTLRGGFGDCPSGPLLVSVDPPYGPLGGGTPTTITGAGFDLTAPGRVAVLFDRREASAVEIAGPTTLTCTAPPGAAAGEVAVTVTHGSETASLDAAFSYVQAATDPVLPTTLDAARYPTLTLPVLYAVQAALIRLCEARTDAVAILSLPLHFEKQDCVGWLQGLRDDLGLPRHGLNYDDGRDVTDLSYAAVYHPWLLVPDPAAPAGVLRPVPPEGAACGAIAAREIARGVWIAPANDPLPGVLDLQPQFTDDDWAALFALGFNATREEAKDFRMMSAHTLADDQRFLQLSVRRLMIQLRKAAYKRGQDYVFNKNDELFRQQMRTRLEDLLGSMFDRGAFAGRTRPDSFRIAVDDTVNTQADFDAGRVVAQIMVAPSQPMEFLTVLLTRSGDGQLQTAEG